MDSNGNPYLLPLGLKFAIPTSFYIELLAIHLPAVFGERYYINPVMAILELRQERQRYYFLFTRDIIDADSFRLLRVKIKHRLNKTAELA